MAEIALQKISKAGAAVTFVAAADGGDFAAVFPELRGCRLDGETSQQARDNAYDAFECWIEGTQELGRAVPQPRRLAA
jgi:predicted RNase H-like HicB family nuclease